MINVFDWFEIMSNDIMLDKCLIDLKKKKLFKWYYVYEVEAEWWMWVYINN